LLANNDDHENEDDLTKDYGQPNHCDGGVEAESENVSNSSGPKDGENQLIGET
jgi:hypothetical protein